MKVWNTQTSTDLSLDGPVGQVYALVVANGMLFAGIQVLTCSPTEYIIVIIHMVCSLITVVLVKGLSFSISYSSLGCRMGVY